MGRPPTHGAPSFRFHAAEVAQMESILREHAGNVPPRDFLVSLAFQFSYSPERAGKSIVQMKQVWNWFQNRRYALRSKLVKPPGNPNFPQGEVSPPTNLPQFPQQAPMPLGHNVVRNASENPPMEFEAKSARDGAWYDVQQFLSHRYFDTGNPEVLVRFAGFGQEEDEWVDVAKYVRHRSLPCESSECIVVLPGDLILCFQEGKEQALYFDAHVLDAQRRRHDVRGCRCRFLVRYDHDQSEEIVPLRKICRRPETDYRLQLLHSTNESVPASSGPADSKNPAVDPASTSTLRGPSSNPLPSHNIVVNPTAVPPTVSPATAASASTSVISLTSNFALTQAPALGHSPTLGQVQAPAPAPSPTLAAASTQVPAQGPILLSGEAPGSSLTPIASATPSPILTSDSATQILYPTPVSVQSSIPVRAPEVRKIESDSPAASSTGVASARDSIANPSAASVIMEVKMEEASIPKTSTEVADGRSVSQGEASENP